MVQRNSESGRINLIDDEVRRMQNEFADILKVAAKSVEDKEAMSFASIKELTQNTEALEVAIQLLEEITPISTLEVRNIVKDLVRQHKKERIEEINKRKRPSDHKNKEFELFEFEAIDGSPDKGDLEEERSEQEFLDEFGEAISLTQELMDMTQINTHVKKKAPPKQNLSQKKIKGKFPNKS